MSTAAAPARVSPTSPDAAPQAHLVVSLENLDVRYASQRAVDWVALPAERLLGRSLLLSLPQIGQALTLAVAAGLNPAPTPLAVAMATPDGQRLSIQAHRRDNDAIIEFRVVSDDRAATPPTGNAVRPVTDPVGLQRRLEEMRQDLMAMRTRIPFEEAMLRGDDPILFWLWQAEAALAQLSRRFPELMANQRKATGTFRRTP